MLRYALASIVIAVLLSACGGSEGGATADDRQVEILSEPTPSSPLESQLGFASDAGRRQYQLVTMQREADASIVRCMKQAGFFYAVGGTADAFRTGAVVGDETREWTAENGLGISSSFIEALTVDAAQVVTDPAATNLEYVASLTTEQAAEYDRALVGDLNASPGPSAEYQPAGCWGEAFTDIVRILSLIGEFEPQLESLNSRLDADPRVLGFQNAWSACMTAAGHSFDNETAMVDEVYARLLDIDLVESMGITQLASPDALQDVATYEREVAVAGFDCRLGFADELGRLRYDYEQEFLDDNRFRIADLVPGTP